MSVTGFNRRRRAETLKQPKASPDVDLDPKLRREFLINEIHQLTGRRPGVKTKDETLEKQYEKLTQDQE